MLCSPGELAVGVLIKTLDQLFSLSSPPVAFFSCPGYLYTQLVKQEL